MFGLVATEMVARLADELRGDLQQFVGCWSLSGVPTRHGCHELRSEREGRGCVVRKPQAATNAFQTDRALHLSLHGAQELYKKHAQRVNVRFDAVWIALELLWACVRWCPNAASARGRWDARRRSHRVLMGGRRRRPVSNDLGEPEVSEQHAPIHGEEDVRRFNVAVRAEAAMHVRQRSYALAKNIASVPGPPPNFFVRGGARRQRRVPARNPSLQSVLTAKLHLDVKRRVVRNTALRILIVLRLQFQLCRRCMSAALWRAQRSPHCRTVMAAVHGLIGCHEDNVAIRLVVLHAAAIAEAEAEARVVRRQCRR
mmetsp:Transcript_30109/g.82744  ORF Transcript_30109/g.82744 Transcript_30109/m.82744 type:complete len:313 (+) Transcript_30109:319-1257(+)